MAGRDSSPTTGVADWSRKDIDPVSRQPFRTLRQYQECAVALLEEPVKTYWEWYLDGKESYRRGDAAYEGLFLRTMALSGVGVPDVTTNVFGQMVTPVGVSPSAFHNLGHPDGEIATARGVAEQAGIYCYNYYYGSKPLEDVAKSWLEHSAEGRGALWLHLYVHSCYESQSEALRRAAETGAFSAVVVTTDHPHDRVHKGTKPAFVAQGRSVDTPNAKDDFNVSEAGWDDLKWLCENSELPVVAKGVMNVEDARRAVEVGCRGVFVSAHGGRQCAQCPSALEQLPKIVAAVGDQVDGNVFVDTGVRCGGHVVKAMALGARAVFVGRPALYGLLCGGHEGVGNVVAILREEARADMACAGARTVDDLGWHSFEVVEGPVRAAIPRRSRSVRCAAAAWVGFVIGVLATAAAYEK